MKLLKIGEVAARLQVSKATVERLIKRGELRSVPVGRLVRIREEDLDSYTGRGDQGGR